MTTSTAYQIKRMSPQLLVSDIERSVEFYTSKLDFKIDFRFEDFYASIIRDNFSIHLKLSEPINDRRKNGEDLDIVFSVDGIEDLYKEILSQSIKITQPLRDMPYGKEFYVADPDGNIIAFIEP